MSGSDLLLATLRARRGGVAGAAALLGAHQAARADRVVFLEHGRVIEQGAHAELVAAGGPYAELWRAWSADRQSSSRIQSPERSQ